MTRLTFSLRVDKLRGESLTYRLGHNWRGKKHMYSPELTYRSDRERLHLNRHWENENYNGLSTSSELRLILDNDFDMAKMNNMTTRKKRIPKTTPRRNSTPIETSISREVFLQIGAVKDNFEVPLEIYMRFIKWLQTIFLGDIIRWDIHDDESIRHLHIIVTTWSLEHHENYTRNSIIDNYSVFQNKTYTELKNFCKQFDIEILAPKPKKETGHEHISPRAYEREILPVQHAKEKIIHETEIAEESLKKLHDGINIARLKLDAILTQANTAEANYQRKEKEHKSNIKKLIDYKEKVDKSIQTQIQRGKQEYKVLHSNLLAIKEKIKTKNNEFELLSEKVEQQVKKMMQQFAEKVQKMSIALLERSLEKLRSAKPKASIKIIRDIIENNEDNVFKPGR